MGISIGRFWEYDHLVFEIKKNAVLRSKSSCLSSISMGHLPVRYIAILDMLDDRVVCIYIHIHTVYM